MILPDYAIKEWIKAGGVHPLGVGCVNPASLDLRISAEYRNLAMPEILQNKSIIELWPSQAILATTMEYIKMPADLAGVMYLKSSWARRGLDHALAGWIDPGFEGQLTMELHTHRPLKIQAGSRLCQLVLYRLEGPVTQVYWALPGTARADGGEMNRREFLKGLAAIPALVRAGKRVLVESEPEAGLEIQCDTPQDVVDLRYWWDSSVKWTTHEFDTGNVTWRWDENTDQAVWMVGVQDES